MSVFWFEMLFIQIALKAKEMGTFLPILATGCHNDRAEFPTVKFVHCCELWQLHLGRLATIIGPHSRTVLTNKFVLKFHFWRFYEDCGIHECFLTQDLFLAKNKIYKHSGALLRTFQCWSEFVERTSALWPDKRERLRSFLSRHITNEHLLLAFDISA